MKREELEEKIGAGETARYFAILERCRAANDFALAQHFYLHEPERIEELAGHFRPGLLAFAKESSGDYLVWDLRKARAGDETPNVLRCDHEIGFLEHVGPTIDRALDTNAEWKRVGLCAIPPTHRPMLAPDDPRCLAETADGHEESLAFFRELVEDEGREAFRWHLADTLRWYADVLLRQEKWRAAKKAAAEAAELYEALDDRRNDAHLAFCERALAVIAARRAKYEEAFAHAEAALVASERFMLDHVAILRATTSAVEGWARERSGDDEYEVELRLKNAQKWSAPHRGRFPVADLLATMGPRKKKAR
ncbi:MAG: hypothetical protein U0270_14615 [Labilithrix sp.]